MKPAIRCLVIVAVTIALMIAQCPPVAAGAIEDGLTAYNEKDYVKALQLWRPLAEQGVAAAQYRLGVLYAEGKGVNASDLIAAVWFQRAAEQGVPEAQYNLGVSYAEGLGVRKDEAIAAKWFRRAADQGNAYAQLNLGLLYAAGRGIAQDNVESVKWLELAIFGLPAGGARSDAAQSLKGVADKLNEEQLLQARTLERTFKPKPEVKAKE